MPAYHSEFNKDQVRIIGKMSLLPLKTQVKGPAPPCQADKTDIIDETLDYFKANVLFRNFEVQGPADTLLVYLTLYATQCLNLIQKKSSPEAAKILYSQSIAAFTLPGDKEFPLGGLVQAPTGRGDADTLRAYLTQARQELGIRLVQRAYWNGVQTEPTKWWALFAKYKFLNLTMK